MIADYGMNSKRTSKRNMGTDGCGVVGDCGDPL